MRQTTGYITIALALFGMLISLRKRYDSLAKVGSFGSFRAFHTVLGTLSVLGVGIHTGLNWGYNLNFVLLLCFLGLSVLGALSGLMTSLENQGSLRLSMWARKARPWMTWIHILLVWPLPVLLAIHIASVYLY